jgi:phosphatidylglycerophosphatase A
LFHSSDKYPDTAAYNYVISELKKRKVSVIDIAKISQELQKKYNSNVKLSEYESAVNDILHKREVLSIAMTGLALDNAASEHNLPEPLQTIIGRDFALYGVDELLAIGITNLYGTVGITNFGYVDKVKKGIIARLDTDENHVNTFVDDLVGAIAVAAGAKIAFAQG